MGPARTSRPKVVLDISWLGYGQPKVGPWRAIETLALRLARHPGCEVRFSAYKSRSVVNRTQRYLDAQRTLERKLLVGHVKLQGVHRRMEDRLVAMNASTSRSLAFRAIRRVVRWGVKSLDKVELLRRADLTGMDVFHSPYYPLPAVTRHVPGMKRVLSVYDLIPIRYPQFCSPNAQARMRAILDSLDPADAVICHSVATQKDLMAYRADVPPEQIAVIPLAADACFRPASMDAVRAVRRQYRLPEGPYVLTVSRIEPRKNIDLVVRAYRRLVEPPGFRDLSLVLCGSSQSERSTLDQASQECGPVSERIVSLGHVPDEDLASLYSGALVFVYPSFCEGFGLPPLEAMQCGTPVIASSATSLPEVVGGAGRLVDPTDVDGLCRALVDLYRNEGLRQDMSRKSLTQAARFQWDRTVQDTVATYQRGLRA